MRVPMTMLPDAAYRDLGNYSEGSIKLPAKNKRASMIR